MSLLCGKNDFLIQFFEFVFEDFVLVADVEIVEVLHKRLHVFESKFSGGREEPVSEYCQLVLVVLEELDAWLALFVVFLLIQVGDFLLDNVFDNVEDSKVRLKILLSVLAALFGFEGDEGLHFFEGLLDLFLLVLYLSKGSYVKVVLLVFVQLITVGIDKAE
jgi:hypothetical protein